MTPGSVLERPETAGEGLTLTEVPDALPKPVQGNSCPQGGDHDWQPGNGCWRCSKCGMTITVDD